MTLHFLLHYRFGYSRGISFTVGLKAKVDLLTDMSTAVDGSASTRQTRR